MELRIFLVAQMVKNLPAMQETRVLSLGWEDSLEKGMAIHSSILAWRIPWREEPGGPQSMGSQRVGHNWATNTFFGLPWWEVVKNLPANAGNIRDLGSIPGSVRSPGGGNGYHTCILAWRIPWREEPGGLQSVGSQRGRHSWETKHSTHVGHSRCV